MGTGMGMGRGRSCDGGKGDVMTATNSIST